MAKRQKGDGDTCRKHPKYKSKSPPRPTNAYPKGCPTCWELFKKRNKEEPAPPPVKRKEPKQLRGKSKNTQFGQPGGPEPGVPAGTIQEYIQSRTKKGKAIVDAMMEIAGLRKPKLEGEELSFKFNATDRIKALQWLAANGFDIEEEDKTRPIQIVNYGELYVGPRPPT